MTVSITPYNDVHIRVHGEPSFEQDLADAFSFEVPHAKFTPKFKLGMWDGRIRLFDRRSGLIYCGLHDQITEYCRDNQIEYDSTVPTEWEVDNSAIDVHIRSLNLPFEPRYYQREALVVGSRFRRRLLVSPTASGKSLIVYMLATWFAEKTLVIVPNLNLLDQFASDCAEYGYKDPIHKIYAAQNKNTDTDITVTTWQSVHRLKSEWFEQFSCVIVDEAHQAKANSIVSILSKLTNCKYRFGLTGSLDDSETNEMVLTGLFGPVTVLATTAELQQKKMLSPCLVRLITLNHSKSNRQQFWSHKQEIQTSDELTWLQNYSKRTRFLCSLAIKNRGNTLLLTNRRQHCDELIHALRQMTDRPIFHVDGRVKGNDRERIRQQVNQTETDAIIVASYKTYSTGVNIPSLKHAIFCSPFRGKIQLLQSVGRLLRLHSDKSRAVIYDISDDLTYRRRRNPTAKQLLRRLQIYEDQQFPISRHSIVI